MMEINKLKKHLKYFLLAATLLAVLTGSAQAAEEPKIDTGDTAWGLSAQPL